MICTLSISKTPPDVVFTPEGVGGECIDLK